MKCHREKPLPAPDPAVVCLGCAKDDTCNHTRSKLCNLGGSRHPTCYREKHTCGKCKKPYWHTTADKCGLCICHPSVTDTKAYATGRDEPACPNFKATQ